jgi:DNA gyrase subunit B
VLTTHDGGQRAGDDLRDLLEQARVQRRWVQTLAAKIGSADIVEQAAIAGALAAGLDGDPNRAIDAAYRTAERLNMIAPLIATGGEAGWRSEVNARGGLIFSRNRQGVEERRLIEWSLLRSSEARRLDNDGERLRDLYQRPGRLTARDREYAIAGPSSLVDSVMEIGRRGIEVNRYKGLGEMNPEQLWETTLDPEVRSLLQVRVSHEDLAEETFSTLMGDLVEPRRDFIQSNALSVANLDV